MPQTAPRKWLRWMVAAPAEADHEVLGEAGRADDLVRDDLTDRDDEVPAGEELLVDLDRDRLCKPAPRERLDLGRGQLPDAREPLPPAVHRDPLERDPATEEQVDLDRAHRSVRAERGQHGDLAPGGGQQSRTGTRRSRPNANGAGCGRAVRAARASTPWQGSPRRDPPDDAPPASGRDRSRSAAAVGEQRGERRAGM